MNLKAQKWPKLMGGRGRANPFEEPKVTSLPFGHFWGVLRGLNHPILSFMDCHRWKFCWPLKHFQIRQAKHEEIMGILWHRHTSALNKCHRWRIDAGGKNNFNLPTGDRTRALLLMSLRGCPSASPSNWGKLRIPPVLWFPQLLGEAEGRPLRCNHYTIGSLLIRGNAIWVLECKVLTHMYFGDHP